jgi:hypothetical protein
VLRSNHHHFESGRASEHYGFGRRGEHRVGRAIDRLFAGSLVLKSMAAPARPRPSAGGAHPHHRSDPAADSRRRRTRHGITSKIVEIDGRRCAASAPPAYHRGLPGDAAKLEDTDGAQIASARAILRSLFERFPDLF